MSGTEIKQLEAGNGAEYQALFLAALRSAPESFAADYDEESARSSEQRRQRVPYLLLCNPSRISSHVRKNVGG